MLELADERVAHLSYERGAGEIVLRGYKFASAKLAAAAALGCLVRSPGAAELIAKVRKPPQGPSILCRNGMDGSAMTEISGCTVQLLLWIHCAAPRLASWESWLLLQADYLFPVRQHALVSCAKSQGACMPYMPPQCQTGFHGSAEPHLHNIWSVVFCHWHTHTVYTDGSGQAQKGAKPLPASWTAEHTWWGCRRLQASWWRC